MRPYLAFANLIAVVTPFTLLACGSAPASETMTTESSAVRGNCPAGTTWECSNEGPGGTRICQCTPDATPVVFTGYVSNLAQGQRLVIEGEGAYAGQFVTTTDTITQNGPYSFQGQAGENTVVVMTPPSNGFCDAVQVSGTNVNFNCGTGVTLPIYVYGGMGLIKSPVPGLQVTVTGGGATNQFTTGQTTSPYDVTFLSGDTVTVSFMTPSGWVCTGDSPSTFLVTTAPYYIRCQQ
jgi:hypothetical protein